MSLNVYSAPRSVREEMQDTITSTAVLEKKFKVVVFNNEREMCESFTVDCLCVI